MSFLKNVLVGAAFVAAWMGSPATAQAVWDSRNPVTLPNTLNNVIWTGTQFVAVGASGAVVTSSDGNSWTYQNLGTTNPTLYGSASNGGSQLVAVGLNGKIFYSNNSGTSWSEATSGTTKPLYGITYGNNRYVAIGGSGAILTSTNGTSWTLSDSLSPQGLNSVVWSTASSRFVAVGNSGFVAYSSTGTSWTLDTSNVLPSTVGATLYGATIAGTNILAGGLNGALRESANGTTWTALTGATGSSILGVAFGSRIVSVGMNGSIQHSTGGTWTGATSGTTQSLNSVAWGAGSVSKFVAVGGTGTILTSSDGIAWTQVSSIHFGLNGVTARYGTAAGDTQFVVAGEAGTVLTSTDGASWTKRTTATNSGLYAISTGGPTSGPTTVAVGAGGLILSATNDLNSWTTRNSTGNPLFAVAGNAAATPTFVAVGQSTILVSTNSGVSWAPPSTPNSDNFLMNGVANNNATTWVAVGDAGGVRRTTSVNGTWAMVTVPGSSPGRLNAVVYATLSPTPLFVAVGVNGGVYTSTTGQSWVSQSSGVNFNLRSVTWTGNVLVATGDNGAVITSTDGVNWTPQTSNVNNNLLGVRWNGKLVAAVGTNGRILTSSPSALPPVPVLSLPASGATGIPVSPILSWVASSGATSYRLQLSTTSGFVDTLIDTTTTGTSFMVGPLTPNTQYHWRVRSNGSSGSSAFSSNFTFTLVNAAGSAPSPVSPTNSATNIPLTTSVNWNPYITGSLTASTYRIQVSTDSLFASTLVNDSIADTTRLLGNLTASTKYFWRVNARLTSGVSAWSTLRRFTTSAPAPSAPTLTSPGDNSIAFPVNGGTLQWSTSVGAASYRVQVSTTSNFSALVRDTVLSGTSLTLTNLATNGVYYWHVSAQNAAGASAYSTSRMFTTTVNAPAKPTLSTPANNATAVSVFTDFKWNAASGAITYHFQLSTDANFGSITLQDSTLTGLVKNAGQLANTTLYYWRVRAKNPAGVSAFSDTRSFTSGVLPTTAPPAPTLLNPAAFATNVTSTSTFNWRHASTATGYRFEISTNPNSFTGSNLVLVDSTLTDSTKTLSGGLQGGVDYFWRVSGKNNIGFGTYSEVRAFTTVITVPEVPVPSTPAQFATGISTSPTLTWSASPGATSYRVQVSLTTSFSGGLVVSEDVTTTSRTIGPLNDNTSYYWQVRASNAAGASAFSNPTFRFTTGATPLPEKPTLVSPAQFATGVAIPVTFRWNKVAGATTYRVQVAGSAFPSGVILILNIPAVADTFLVVSSLPADSTLYWQVSAANVAGSGEFSSISRFRTEPGVAILSNRLTGRQSLLNQGALNFDLTNRKRVRIRMFNTEGRRVAPDFDKVLEGGHHSIPLPEALKNSFFLLEFEVGTEKQILKIHPR